MQCVSQVYLLRCTDCLGVPKGHNRKFVNSNTRVESADSLNINSLGVRHILRHCAAVAIDLGDY